MDKDVQQAGWGDDGRMLWKYPKTTYSLRSTCEKIGVDKLKGRKIKRLIHVMGSGRSGTTFMAKCFQAIGLDVQHERTGRHGTSSLFFTAGDHHWYPALPWYKGRNHYGERYSDFEFQWRIHVVRHPLKTIPSIGKIFNGLNYEFLEELGIIPKNIKNKMLRCAWVYYGLNTMAESRDPHMMVQLENIANDWPNIMQVMGMGPHPFPDLPPANRGTGFRKSEPLTWQELERLDEELCYSINNMSRRYGYRT